MLSETSRRLQGVSNHVPCDKRVGNGRCTATLLSVTKLTAGDRTALLEPRDATRAATDREQLELHDYYQRHQTGRRCSFNSPNFNLASHSHWPASTTNVNVLF